MALLKRRAEMDELCDIVEQLRVAQPTERTTGPARGRSSVLDYMHNARCICMPKI